MSMVVSGRFSQKTGAERAVQTLLSGGIRADHIIHALHMSGLYDVSASADAAAKDGGAGTTPEDTTMAGAAGFLVAVNTPVETERAFAASALRQHGAVDVEETERALHEGTWVEFDIPAAPCNSTKPHS